MKTPILTFSKIFNGLSFLILMLIGCYYLYAALTQISGNGSIASETGKLFMKGIPILALFPLPLLAFVFFKNKHSIYTVLIITCINVAITAIVVYGTFF